MVASYTKGKEEYNIHLGDISFNIPFKLRVSHCAVVNVDDEIINDLIQRYNDNLFEWKYHGEVIPEEEVKSLIENGNYKKIIMWNFQSKN